MTARIVSIGTAVPPTRLPQAHVRDLFASQPGIDRLTMRRITAAFDAAQIDSRYTVLAELGEAASGAVPDRGPTDAAFLDAAGTLLHPLTGARNDLYARFAPPLYAEAARRALADADVEASAVTHVVTVSCTGFFAPGPDYRLVRDLGLTTTVERYHLGFIGCAAALPAVRMAEHICRAQPRAVVLVVCVELCSLHIRASQDPQQIVAASVFADGAAAAVVTADPAVGTAGGLELERFATTVTSEGETDMVWTIGDNGFEMTLTPQVPRIIGREIGEAVRSFLGGAPTPGAWAVHPGGRSVLDRVESGLALPPEAIDASRRVLREYGNMSSATVLFILRELLRDDTIADGDAIAAIAFGPGLTVESALLTKRAVAAAPTAVRERAGLAMADA
jgi:predicted naringenin-chalcone synthase